MASFDVGQQFHNYEAFLLAFHELCWKNNQPLTITTNNKKQVTVLCRHGVKRESRSTGKRSHLRYNYLACEAKITCFKPATSTVIKVTSVNLHHNHEVSKAAFRSVELGEQEKEVIADLHNANCKVSEIARVVKKKFDKNLSTQKIRNLIRSLISPETDDSLLLQNFLERVDEERGTVEYDVDADGHVSNLFVSTYAMRNAFLASCCTTVQIDTSFDIDASKYKLCGFCYLNPATNKSEFAALAFFGE